MQNQNSLVLIQQIVVLSENQEKVKMSSRKQSLQCYKIH
jgi:hypothetical protein